jgi:DNA end-binding protein Ku
MKMAQSLIEAMSGEFEPRQFKDTYRERLQAMIDAKVKGHKTVEAPQAQEMAPVIDIMDALKRSLSTFKKPAVSETSDTKPRTSKRRAG